MMKLCMEIVSYQLKEGVNVQKFMGFLNQLQELINSKEGYISRKIFYDEENTVWVELTEWESLEKAKKCAADLI